MSFFGLDCYGEGPEDYEVVTPGLPKKSGDPDNPEDLGPYRPLHVSRLKLTGRGGWDISNHLMMNCGCPMLNLAFCSPEKKGFQMRGG